MAVYKEEKTNTWRAVYRYTDWERRAQADPEAGLQDQTGGTGLGARTAQQDQR